MSEAKTPLPLRMATTEPQLSWIYFFDDGTIQRTLGSKPDALLFEDELLHTVMVSVPKRGKILPYIEIVYSKRGPSSIILTATQLSEGITRND